MKESSELHFLTGSGDHVPRCGASAADGADKWDKLLLAGNHRTSTAQFAGVDRQPGTTRQTDTPDPTKNVLRVVDNRLLRGPPGC